MAKIKGKFITLVGKLMLLYKEGLNEANKELIARTGKNYTELDQESWYEITLFNLFLEKYCQYSPGGERSLITVGKNIYPTIKKTVGLPSQLKTPLDFIKFEAEGFLANHQGVEIKPRKFIKAEERDVIVQAPAPGYSPKLYEGVYLGILEICGVKTGKVTQTKAIKNGDVTDEFHITW